MKIKNTQQKIFNVIFLCFLIPFFSFSSLQDKPDFRIKTIVIDAGHGGEDGATRGVLAREKDVALEVALKLGQKIESEDRKSTRLNSSHVRISYAVFCLKKKINT